jgi:hypothetical protein
MEAYKTEEKYTHGIREHRRLAGARKIWKSKSFEEDVVRFKGADR